MHREKTEHHRKIEQAYVSAYTLTDEQTRKLIQDKFERADKLREALEKSNLLQPTDQ
jgi:hypothetical protein